MSRASARGGRSGPTWVSGDESMCTTNNASNNSSVDAGDDSSVLSGNNGTYNTGQDGTYNGTNRSSEHSDNSTYCSGQDTSVNGTNRTSQLTAQYIDYNSSYDNSVLSSRNGSYYTATYCSGVV